MANNSWLTGDEKHKQISTKNSIVRRRKKATQANAQSISKAGYISPEAKQKYNDTQSRIAEQFEAAKKKSKEMPSWERKKVQQDAQNKQSKIKNR